MVHMQHLGLHLSVTLLQLESILTSSRCPQDGCLLHFPFLRCFPSALTLSITFTFSLYKSTWVHILFPASEDIVEPTRAHVLVCKGRRWFSIRLFPWYCGRRVMTWPDLRRHQAAISFASPALEFPCILYVILPDSVLKADKMLILCMWLLNIFCKNQERVALLPWLETPSTGDASGAQRRLDIHSREQEWIPLAGYGPSSVSEAQEPHACWNKQMNDKSSCNWIHRVCGELFHTLRRL